MKEDQWLLVNEQGLENNWKKKHKVLQGCYYGVIDNILPFIVEMVAQVYICMPNLPKLFIINISLSVLYYMCIRFE